MEFDFGLSDLGSRFHMDWRHDGPDPAAVVRNWAGLVAVDEAGREEIRLLRQDVRRLVDSPLTDEEIQALWRAAAPYYPVGPGTPRGRAWLTEIERVVRPVAKGAEAVGGPASADDSDVQAVVRLAGTLDQVHDLPLEPVPVAVVREALTRCAEEVDGDLAFRLLLRAWAAYGTPVSAADHAELRRLTASLGHGALLLATVDYLTE